MQNTVYPMGLSWDKTPIIPWYGSIMTKENPEAFVN